MFFLSATPFLIVIGLFSLSCSAMDSLEAFDHFSLQKYAEGYKEGETIKGGYGYKAANSTELKKIIALLMHQKPPGLTMKLAVPDFAAISSENLKRFLKNRVDISKEWGKITTQFSDENQKNVLVEKQFHKTFLSLIKNLEKKTQDALKKKVQTRLKSSKKISLDAELRENGIDALLEQIRNDQGLAIVRSSGKYEDSSYQSNPGGHESVSCVIPEPTEILHAMGCGDLDKPGVVPSYFTRKAFEQRLETGAKLENILEEPLTPVLIQKMIGERPNGIRSKNIKKFLVEQAKKKFIPLDQSLIKPLITEAATHSNFSFNKDFNAQDSRIDEMLSQARKEGWSIQISSPESASLKRKTAPKKESVAAAIAEVVAQKIEDTGNIKNAHCAVIVEPIMDDKIIDREPTVCGVMLTEEINGEISHKQLLAEQDPLSQQIETSGITIIQAAYGHNEGVVNGLINVDTYLVTDELTHSIIRPKLVRKFPSLKRGTKLEFRKNPKERATTSALLPKEIRALKIFANEIERYYKRPMDVEFVIDRSTQTIYIVQVRPIVPSKKKTDPSYLKDIEKIDSPQIKGTTVCFAGGATRLISSKINIITKETIGEALDTYLHYTKDREAIECIIIGQYAHSATHEAMIFNLLNIPVIFTADFKKIEKFLSSTEDQFLIDVQQEIIVQLQERITSLDKLKEQKILVSGWKNYPLSREISLSKVHFPIKNVDKDFEVFINTELIKTDPIPSNSQEKESDEKKDETLEQTKTSLHEYLSSIQRDEKGEVYRNLRNLLTVLNHKIKQAYLYTSDDELKNNLQLLKKHILETARALANTLKKEPSRKNKAQQQYYCRILETLIFQQPTIEKVIQGESIATLILRTIEPEYRIEQLLKNFSKNQNHGKDLDLEKKLVQLARAQEFCLSHQTRTKWLYLIANFEELKLTQKEQADFIFIIATLQTTGALPIWLHTSFEDFFDHKDLKNTIIRLTQEFNKTEEIFLWIKEQSQAIRNINPETFADPKAYLIQFEKFNKIITSVTNGDIEQKFKKTTKLGKFAILLMLEPLVDVFDRSIKSAKLQKNIARFKEMLNVQFKLLQVICNLCYSSKEMDCAYFKMHAHGESSNIIIQKMEIVTETLYSAKINEERHMFKSPGFDVNISAIGSTADFEHPETLEDIFTFVHQSLINVNSWLMQKVGLDRFARVDSDILPEQIKWMLRNLYEIKEKEDGKQIPESQKISLMGVSFKNENLRLRFNYPLRSHSSIVTLEFFNKKKPFMQLQCTSSGENEWGRFYKMGEFAETVGNILSLEPKISYSKKSVLFVWTITQETIATLEELFPQKNIIGQALEWANDGNEGDNGLAYATLTEKYDDITKSVFDREASALHFITSTFCENDPFKLKHFAKCVINQSLEQNCVHMYIDRILPFIGDDEEGAALWQKVFNIMNKILTEELYSTKSDLKFFKFYRSARAGGLDQIKQGEILFDIEDTYYDITEENLYEKLDHDKIVKDSAPGSMGILRRLSIESFKKSYARILFQKIVSLFIEGKIPQQTKIHLAEFMQNHAAFFSSLKTIEFDSSIGKYTYTPNQQLGKLLEDPFFSEGEGLKAKEAIEKHHQK